MRTKNLLLFLIPAFLASAQVFEVAAIHPNTAGGTPLTHALPGGLLSPTNTSLQTPLIRVAYRVGVPQISGPDWLPSVHFDISAKGVPEDFSLASDGSKDQGSACRAVGLVAHEETVMESAIVLSNGVGIVPSEGGDAVLHMS